MPGDGQSPPEQYNTVSSTDR